jgi:secreted PhoX family phosphatase
MKIYKSGGRREFLEFMGRAAAAGAIGQLVSTNAQGMSRAPQKPTFTSIKPTTKDDLVLAEGLSYKVLLKWGDKINAQGEKFGFNSDYNAYIPLDGEKEGILWTNHETASPFFVSGFKKGVKTKEQVEKEQDAVGGSLVHIKNDKGNWSVVPDSKYNKRVSGRTMIKFSDGHTLVGKKEGRGTLSNCAGGVTPWQTVLTCEENYHKFYGEVSFDGGKRKVDHSECQTLQWYKHFPEPPEHFGWVVEVDPKTGDSVKQLNLGRFAHECATCAPAKNGNVVVYMGDDANDECIYKFVSNSPSDFKSGTLYVADLENGKWLPLSVETNTELKKKFKSQKQLLIETRAAAHMVGGTRTDRPEDVEIDPKTGAVFVTLTNNYAKGNMYGGILRIAEANNDPGAMIFKASMWLKGGDANGFACPDNLAFDENGNMWMVSDISESVIRTDTYKKFGNNGLYFIPTSGDDAGTVYQVGSAPVDAELTGPYFSPDYKTLFLSIQHPGSKSKSHSEYTSTWPDGSPKPSVVTIQGPLLEQLAKKA